MEVHKAIGIPKMMGRKERFIRRLAVSESRRGSTRKSAHRTPSRLRKRMVVRINSNWIAATPNAEGEARRKRAWFRIKVKVRDKS